MLTQKKKKKTVVTAGRLQLSVIGNSKRPHSGIAAHSLEIMRLEAIIRRMPFI